MKIINRKASHEYTIINRIEAGVSLLGSEVKSLRLGKGKLDGAYVKIASGEVFLINAEIMPYSYARPNGYDPKRTRKLLLHKKEAISLQSKLDSAKLTLIPLSWYTKGPQIKLEIGLARGRKEYEKREKIKREDQKRELERDFRGKIT
ncbi:MAG: SsrA-binding protein, SsrA-binding protein [Microgenomates group bacterium GW2011_GWC1_39_12]|nr:MAG: SsrA-binding protein, SsrA-binding protein [Microgenomates group bacterium GW2011_GWC1_39_12]